MPLIGILSDTHGSLPEAAIDFFANCDEIWHAGDIGSLDILHKLSKISKTKAVYGNIDSQEIRLHVPELLVFEYASIKIMLKHIVGRPGKYTAETNNEINRIKPDILIAGHSHILNIRYDKKNKLLFINPGAAGKYGLHKQQSMVRLYIEKQKIKNIEIWDKSRNKAF